MAPPGPVPSRTVGPLPGAATLRGRRRAPAPIPAPVVPAVIRSFPGGTGARGGSTPAGTVGRSGRATAPTHTVLPVGTAATARTATGLGPAVTRLPAVPAGLTGSRGVGSIRASTWTGDALGIAPGLPGRTISAGSGRAIRPVAGRTPVGTGTALAPILPGAGRRLAPAQTCRALVLPRRARPLALPGIIRTLAPAETARTPVLPGPGRTLAPARIARAPILPGFGRMPARSGPRRTAARPEITPALRRFVTRGAGFGRAGVGMTPEAPGPVAARAGHSTTAPGAGRAPRAQSSAAIIRLPCGCT